MGFWSWHLRNTPRYAWSFKVSMFFFFSLAPLCRCAPKSARADPACLKFVSLELWGARAGASPWPATVTVTGPSCPHPVRTVNQEQSVRVSLIKIILSHYSCVNAKCHFKQQYCTRWAGCLPKVRGFVWSSEVCRLEGWQIYSVPDYEVMKEKSIKGIVHPKMILHPFTDHRFVNGLLQ